MKKEYQVAAYLTKEEYENLKIYITSHNTNGYDSSISSYLRNLILKHIESNTISIQSEKEVIPIVESNKGLSIADLDW